MQIRATDFFEQLLRPEFRNWSVLRKDGHAEPFDPLTLAASFIESEVDLKSSAEVFDDVVARLDADAYSGTLTYERIHKTVISVLLNSPHPHAAMWLANYDNLFGPELADLSSADGYVNVRNVAELKKQILAILADILNRESPKAVSEQLGDAELEVVIARLVRVVRYCGFYRVRQSFLRSFVEELASSSCKTFFNANRLLDDDIRNALDSAENWIGSARSIRSDNPQEQLTLLHLALEKASAITLERLGHLPHPTSLTSFAKLIGILRHLKTFIQGQGELPLPLRTLYLELEKSLHSCHIPVLSFIEELDALDTSIATKATTKACLQAYGVIGNLRLMFVPNETLQQLHEYECLRDIPERYLTLALDIFTQAGIPSEFDASIRRLDVALDIGFHEILDHGRKLGIRCNFTATPTGITTDVITKVTEDMMRHEDIIPVIIMNHDMSTENQRAIHDLALRYHRPICVLDRKHFERGLRRPRLLRDEVLRVSDKLVPEASNWRGQIFHVQQYTLPENLRPHEQHVLAKALAQVRDGDGATACQTVAIAHEATVRELVLLIHSACHLAIAKSNDLPSLPREPSDRGLRAYMDWLRAFRQECEQHRTLQRLILPLIPSPRVFEHLDDLRQRRNDYIHADHEVSREEARRYIRDVASSIASIQDLMREFQPAAIIYCDNQNYFVFVKIEDNQPSTLPRSGSPNATLGPLAFVYLTRGGGFHALVPAKALCDHCHMAVLLSDCSGKGCFYCPRCKEWKQLPKTWHKILKDAEHWSRRKKAEHNIEARHQESFEPATQKGGELMNTRVRPWLKALAEAIATAAGPMAAPLKGILTWSEAEGAIATERKLDLIIQDVKELRREILLPALMKDAQTSPAVQILVDSLIGYLKQESASRRTPDEILKNIEKGVRWPYVSITNVRETDLQKELLRLYETNLELLYTHLGLAAYNTAVLKRTMTPDTDTFAFVISLRGRSPKMVREVFEVLCDKNDGSSIFKRILDQLTTVLQSIEQSPSS